MVILLAEDDEPIAEVVKMGLEGEQYRVEVAYDGITAFEMATEGVYSLFILDIMLPGMDGLTLCQRLRARRNQTPILMLTARDSLQDRVRGLDIGADDYLTKPFEFPELLARVRALIRREHTQRSRYLSIADLSIDTAAHTVTRAGHEVTLTPREYLLLEALATREGRVLTREFIQEHIWMDDESYSNTVDVCIGQIRKKIDTGFDTKLIHTVHRIGYMLRVPEEHHEAPQQ